MVSLSLSLSPFLSPSLSLSLTHRYNQLALTAEGDRIESEKLRLQVTRLQDELQESLFSVEKNAHAMRQRERENLQVWYSLSDCISDLSLTLLFFLFTLFHYLLLSLSLSLSNSISLPLQAAQADTHAKIVRATDERDILHEANVRAAQEQYLREMANLREEMMEARKR